MINVFESGLQKPTVKIIIPFKAATCRKELHVGGKGSPSKRKNSSVIRGS